MVPWQSRSMIGSNEQFKQDFPTSCAPSGSCGVNFLYHPGCPGCPGCWEWFSLQGPGLSATQLWAVPCSSVQLEGAQGITSRICLGKRQKVVSQHHTNLTSDLLYICIYRYSGLAGIVVTQARLRKRKRNPEKLFVAIFARPLILNLLAPSSSLALNCDKI